MTLQKTYDDGNGRQLTIEQDLEAGTTTVTTRDGVFVTDRITLPTAQWRILVGYPDAERLAHQQEVS